MLCIGLFGFNKYLEVLNYMIDILGAAKDIEADRTGGYLCVADSHGAPLALMVCGEVLPEKALKYASFAQEKANRLGQNRRDHSSWRSRDPENEKYGGAIRCDDFIFSFSGFSELMDEAMMLMLAVKLGVLSGVGASAIAQVSQNGRWNDLRIRIPPMLPMGSLVQVGP